MKKEIKFIRESLVFDLNNCKAKLLKEDILNRHIEYYNNRIEKINSLLLEDNANTFSDEEIFIVRDAMLSYLRREEYKYNKDNDDIFRKYNRLMWRIKENKGLDFE